MVTGAEVSSLADLAAPENRADLHSFVKASGLTVDEAILECLLQALSLGLDPQRLVEGLRKLTDAEEASASASSSLAFSVPGAAIKNLPTSARKATASGRVDLAN